MPNKRDARQSEFLTLVRRGLTARAAADVVGVHRSTAQRWLKHIGSTEASPRRAPVKARQWWESDDPDQAAVLGAMRTRSRALWPAYPVDDPRLWFLVEASNDPVLVGLREQLLGVRSG